MASKKEEITITSMEDVRKLPPEEQKKWEIAEELGLFDKIVSSGWKSLTGKESGQIGGYLSAWQKASTQADETGTPK